MKKIINIVLVVFLLLPLLAQAYPSDDFESYSLGDLNGNNGGTGWTEAWGASVGCGSATDVLDTPVISGSRIAGGTSAGSYCYRKFTADIVDDSIFYFKIRLPQTNLTQRILLEKLGVAGTPFHFEIRSTGQLAVYDNITLTNLQAYQSNTTYQISIQTRWSSEEYRIRIDDNNWSAWYHFYDYLSYNYTGGADRFVSAIENSGSLYFDDIGIAPISSESSATRSLTTFEISQVFFMGLILFFSGFSIMIWVLQRYLK